LLLAHLTKHQREYIYASTHPISAYWTTKCGISA